MGSAAMAVPLMGLQLAGGYMQGSANAKAGAYEGQIDDMNAALMRRYAVDAVDRGNVMAGRALSRGSQVVGAARAAGGASGFTVDSSSMSDALATTRMMSALDAKTTQSNAAREALGYETQAMNFTAQGNLARYRGRAGQIASILGSAGGAAQTGYGMGFPSFGVGNTGGGGIMDGPYGASGNAGYASDLS